MHILLFLHLYTGCVWGITQIFATTLSSQSINIYLKLAPNNDILKLIKKFNNYLSEKTIFSQYHLTPFLDNHPLHLTLYLTNFTPEHLPQISRCVQRIANHTKPLVIKSNKIEASSSMYIMLLIHNTKSLQALSNKVVTQLMAFRDKKTCIPPWVKNNKRKVQAFLRFGSPNVFANFSPHFSIFAANYLTPRNSEKLQEILISFINEFNKIQTIVDAKAIAIGIGLADAQGQILHELYEFPLNG
ncbi:2'-5' RNA ligase superfamily protein [Legionella jamestowniensis DSM 19215]|nr:2'-5' RNA ligase superfamily protein [Legionella jamestowniensis DSM 19215]